MKVWLSTGLVILVISLSACTVFAQQDASVALLKDQITQLERLAQSAESTAGMRASSLKLLELKRAELRTSLKMQIGSLRTYQSKYGFRFSAKENQRVTGLIRGLEIELQNLAASLLMNLSSPLQEKGHAEKPQRRLLPANNIRTALPEERVSLKRGNESTFRPRGIENEYMPPASTTASGQNVPPTATQSSARMNVNLIPVRAALPRVSALAAAAATPPDSVVIPVYWDSSRSAPPCPPSGTERQDVIFRLTGINDLLVDFSQNRSLAYRLSTKKYARSQVPAENPFALQSGRIRVKDASCPAITTSGQLLAVLDRIRQRVRGNNSISPVSEGGRSIPLSETRNAALSIPEVRCVLGLISENSANPLFAQSGIQYHPVFLWIKRIDGSHSIDLRVFLEPEYNYDFKIEELWGGTATQGGTVKANCGERDLFTLSLGPIVSTMPSRTYEIRKSPVPAGSSTVKEILTVGNGRNINVLGAALLNYHLPRWSWLPSETGLALSAGPVYTLGSTPEVSALGLFAGVSIHLNRSIFITPGVHIGEFADFPPGFSPGDVIPDGFGELNPVKRRTAKFAIGLTYKTASFKQSGGDEEPPASPNGGDSGDDDTPTGNQEPPAPETPESPETETPGTPGTGTPGTPGTGTPNVPAPAQITQPTPTRSPSPARTDRTSPASKRRP